MPFLQYLNSHHFHRWLRFRFLPMLFQIQIRFPSHFQILVEFRQWSGEMLNSLLRWILVPILLLGPAQQHFLVRGLGFLVQIQLHPFLFVNQSLLSDLEYEDALLLLFQTALFLPSFDCAMNSIAPLHLQMGHNNPS